MKQAVYGKKEGELLAAIAQKNVRSLAGIAARLREEAAALDDLAVAMAQQDSAISLPESLDQSQQALSLIHI